MISNIFSKINWVDVLIVITFFWTIFRGIKGGFIKEVFSLIATVFSLFISFHFFSDLSTFFVNKISISPALVDVVIFSALWAGSFFLFGLIEKGLFFLFSIEAHPIIDKWGSALLAVGRASLISSTLLFAFILSAHPYLQSITLQSFARKGLLHLAPTTYEIGFHRVVSRFFEEEHLNQHVRAVLRGESVRRKKAIKKETPVQRKQKADPDDQ